jgi:antitoxin CcdA
MRHGSFASGKRKPVNLTIDTGVVVAAREAGVNLSQISEVALRRAANEARDAA